MHYGYLALGGPTLADPRFELLNTGRVDEYVRNWNIQQCQGEVKGRTLDWLDPCDECGPADLVFTNGEGYTLPQLDPAPWYDPLVKDSDKFFGVVGLGVEGAEDSTRSASVENSVEGGGAVSRLRFGPRTLVVRGLAVAATDCGMEVGLNWLRCQYETTTEECGNDRLWFLDCCPDCVSDPNAPAVGPCWPDTYAQLASPWTIDCDGAWTPTTYDDLVTGPPDYTTSGWCSWVNIYWELNRGLPEFACDLNECLVPYIRNFQQVRVVEGPIVLRRHDAPNGTQWAEIEFTIACGDPHEYTPTDPVLAATILPTPTLYNDPPVAVQYSDPFQRGRRLPQRTRSSNQLGMPVQWERAVVPLSAKRRKSSLTGLAASVLLWADSGEDAGIIRVGVWQGTELLGGFVLPYLPAGGVVKVDGITREVVTEYDGQVRAFGGFARDYLGRAVGKLPELRAGGVYEVTIDQEVGKVRELVVELAAAEKGCA